MLYKYGTANVSSRSRAGAGNRAWQYQKTCGAISLAGNPAAENGGAAAASDRGVIRRQTSLAAAQLASALSQCGR